MKFLEPVRFSPARNSGNLIDYLSWYYETYSFGGNTYTLPVTTTMQAEKAEAIPHNFAGYISGGLQSNGLVFGLERVRLSVFSQGRFQWQQMRNGRPADLFGDQSLGLLERPWPGGVTSDLLAFMLLDADMAGNGYYTRIGNQIVRLRPDWTEILLGERIGQVGPPQKAGYVYWYDGRFSGNDPVLFLANEVAHFAPLPDPLANYRGMSWITPVVRELMADQAATTHKLKFFENAATPNLAVSLPKEITPQQFAEFVDKMDDQHQGWQNAYKTLYTAGGADVTVIGANMQQLDFKVTQGAGETRVALAAGVHPTVAGLSEGLQGSSLNAGNFGQARRQFADITLEHLWNNVSASLEVLFPPRIGTRLTIDRRDIPFLAEDQKDAAEILNMQADAIRKLTDGGYDPKTVVPSVLSGDLSSLTHTGLLPVQLQPPGSGDMNNSAATTNDDEPPAAA